MKRLAVLAAVAGAASCQPALPEPVAECLQVSTNLTRSPATVKLIQHVGTGEPDVFLTIDAANAYGTDVRGQYACTMSKEDYGWVVTSVRIDGAEVDPMAVAGAKFQAISQRVAPSR